MANKYPNHAIPVERPVCAALIQEILDLDLGFEVWISDGEDTVYKGTNKLEALKEMAGTGEDTISLVKRVEGENPVRYGWFYLIYNNGSDNEPMIVISDYSANERCETIWKKLDKKFG